MPIAWANFKGAEEVNFIRAELDKYERWIKTDKLDNFLLEDTIDVMQRANVMKSYKERINNILQSLQKLMSVEEYDKIWSEVAPPSENIIDAKDMFGQIKTPKDPIEEIIISFNTKYAAITIGGTFWILKEENGEVDFMTRKAFIEKHENIKLTIQSTTSGGNAVSKEVPATKVWLESPKRRTFVGYVFDPHCQTGLKIFNTYRGFVIKGAPGNCPLTMAYIRDIICNNDERKYQKLIKYLRHMIQRPWEKVEYAILLIGDKGVGKSFLIDILEALIDGKFTFERRSRHCYRTSNSEDIYGRFRDHLQNRIMLALEEVTYGNDRRHTGTLNDYITGKTLKAEKKNGPILDLTNVMRIFMTANPGHTIPATTDERRYMVLHVNNTHQQDHSYFAAIQNELNNGGYEAFMYELENGSIDDFNCREALHTDALVDQIRRGQTTEEKWWDELLMKGVLYFNEKDNKIKADDTIWVCSGREVLRQDYFKFMKKYYSRATPLTETQIGRRLREFLPLVVNGRVVMNDDGRSVISIIEEKRSGKEKWYCYVLPPLATCRALWDFRLKRNFVWPEPMDWDAPEPEIMDRS
jgi:hypothetical protein